MLINRYLFIYLKSYIYIYIYIYNDDFGESVALKVICIYVSMSIGY